MSDQERSIAEIIGWHFVDDLWDADRYETPEGKRWVMRGADPPYTVDDLLAWLRERGAHPNLARPGGFNINPIMLVVTLRETVGTYDNGEKWRRSVVQVVEGPTLLAAFEAAVRLVAAQA